MELSILHKTIGRQHNETHQTLFERGGRMERVRDYCRGGEIIQNTLYASRELSQ
jgi:hypothetical protein